MDKLRIALIAGGRSGEREVSLRSGDAVYEALDRRKYDVSRYDPRDDLIGLIRDREKIDLAFVLLHGRFGEDGCIQGFLQLLDIPFVGSGVLASAMAIHKKMSKDLYRLAGLRVAEDAMLTRGEVFSAEGIVASLGNTLVVKPVSEGSSLGMSICRSPEELSKGIEEAFRHDSEIMIERFIQGREFTCCVLGNTVLETLPIVEIIPNPEHPFFDYTAKYTPGASKEICPASISEDERREMELYAKEAHRVLRCSVWSRTDMILQEDKIHILETNTVPGMTATSLVPLAARAAGMSMPDLLDRLIEISLEGQEKT